MSGHLEFRDGRRLSAADLNQEDAARRADLDLHERLAHRDDGLVGSRISAPGAGAALDFTPDGLGAELRCTLGDAAQALRLSASRGHRAEAVTAYGTEVRVARAVRLVAATGPPEPSLPWSVRAIDVRGDDGALLSRELRVELGVPLGSPAHSSRLTVGRTVDNTFVPVLVVDAAGSVRVVGDLRVAGTATQGAIRPDPTDPRFVSLLTDVLARRIVDTAVAAPTAGLQLAAQIDPARSTPQKATLAVTLTPAVTLARWGAALAVHRSGTTRFGLVTRGRDAAPGAAVRFPAAVEWTPDVSAAAPARLAVAVVAFDLQSRVFAQSASVTVP